MTHDLAARAVSAHRHAAADDLAVGDDVGLDVVKPRGASEAHAETGDHCSKISRDAVALRDRAQNSGTLSFATTNRLVRRDGFR